MSDDEFITSDPIEVESNPPGHGHGHAHGGHGYGHGHTHSHGHAEHGGFGHNDIAAEHDHDAATAVAAAKEEDDAPSPEPEQAEESSAGQEEPGLIVVLAQTAQRIAPSTPEARVRLTCIFSAMLLAGIAIAIAMPKRR